MYMFLLFFFFVNTTYISFDLDILLEFFIWIVCIIILEGRICHTTRYQGLSPSLGIVSIPFGPVHPETSALIFFHTFSLLYLTLSLYSCLFWNMFSTHPV